MYSKKYFLIMSDNCPDHRYDCMRKLYCTIEGILLVSALLLTASAQMTVDSHDVMPGGPAVFTIRISNTGETPLNPVKLIDTLPKGMSYVTDDSDPKGQPTGSELIWPNVGPIDIGDSTAIHLITKIDPGATGRLTNKVSVIGTPLPEGYNVTSLDEEYVDVREPKIKRNDERTEIGDQVALATGNGRATNNIKVVSG
jgi:uncharacterized repeat protein (TIGR01451 family)